MNNPYAITCSSTADLPERYLKERGIPYACFHFHINGKEFNDDLGRSIPFEEFYQKIREGAMPTTSQINPEQYVAMFEPLLQEGKDIIHLTLSSGISGTYNSALIARDNLLERYPKRRIEIIDSLTASAGYGLLVDTAWEKMQAGAGYEDLALWLKENRLRIQSWFFTSDLTHFRRGGRLSAPAAFFGSMLNICPLMNIDYEGKLIPRDKYRGKKKVVREIVDRMKEYAEGGLDYSGKCFMCHSSCAGDAQEVKSLVEETFPHMNGSVFLVDIGTVIGSHTGPGTVALFFWGDKRTD